MRNKQYEENLKLRVVLIFHIIYFILFPFFLGKKEKEKSKFYITYHVFIDLCKLKFKQKYQKNKTHSDHM